MSRLWALKRARRPSRSRLHERVPLGASLERERQLALVGASQHVQKAGLERESDR